MRRRRQNEGGYALLLVFALAAAVAVKLYLEMPRVAFEHQRNKEGLLVERGEQFIRAIKLYYRKNQKWPQNLDDLEKSQDTRYLRKRYKDPMTGEDEWRLVHIDGAGQYTDSLIKKQGEEEEKTPDILAARVQGIGASAQVIDPSGDASGASNPALQRRASDRIIPGASGGEAAPDAESQPPAPPSGVAVPPEGSMTGRASQPQAPGQTPVTAQPVQGGAGGAAGSQGGSATGAGGTAASTGQSGSTGSSFGMGGGFGFGSGAAASQGQQTSGSPSPNVGAGLTRGGFGAPSANAGAPGQAGQQNQALRLINQILSAPRQSGPGGVLGAQRGTGVATGIGGLAGVASKKDMEGILVYNEQTNYKKWEFVYDLKKELEAKGMMGGPANQASQGQSGQGQNQQSSQPRQGRLFGTTPQTQGKQ